MTVQLNHTIVWCRDKQRSASFLTEILGLPPATVFGPFLVVDVANNVSLDFGDDIAEDEIAPQHYAFLISEEEFDQIFGRIQQRDITYWADPGRTQPSTIYRHFGGRGVYFQDPDGHLLEVMTRPYGNEG